MKKFKNIMDYTHGMINIDSFFFKFIDTIQLQRLRDIHQLSTSLYVFPSVNHSRFEHSLGTYFIANKFMKYFKENQPELDINQNLINSISICALLHNVGHTCYTNSFSSFLKDKYNYDFNRFEMAEKIFDDILNKENIDSKTNNENEQFDEKICKKILLRKEKSSHFYEEIVNNTKNGIDANIFDYLKRDIYKYGFPKQSFEYQILMNNAFVINDEICYRAQDSYPILDLFKSRFFMAKTFYLHRIAMGVELMIKDMFLEADSIYKFYDRINNLNDFYKLNDYIYNDILRSKNIKLNNAKKIVERIQKRDLYSFAGEYCSSNKQYSYDQFNENVLLSYTSSTEVPITEKDIRIIKLKLNLGIDENDPLTHVSLYDDNRNIVKKIGDEISHLLPKKFQEKIIRVYVTSNDEKKISSAQQALINYCKEKCGSEPTLYKSAKQFQTNNELFNSKNFESFSKQLFK